MKRGGEALAAAMDVGQPDQVQSALSGIGENVEKVDILVNNAGVARDNLILRMKEEEWRQCLAPTWTVFIWDFSADGRGHG